MSLPSHVEVWLLLVHPDKVPDIGQVLPLSYFQSITALALLPALDPNVRECLSNIFTKNNIQVLSTNDDCPSPLTTAMSKGQVEIVCVYIGRVSSLLAGGSWLIHLIAETINEAPLKALLPKICYYCGDSVPKTAEHMLREGVTNIIEQLVRLGGNMRYRSESGTSFLYLAIKKRCLPLVQLLLRNGADIYALTEKNETVLHLAISHGAPISMVEYFLGLGVDVNYAGGANVETALLSCLECTRGDVLDLAETLLKNGADVNACSMRGSVLSLAVLNGPEYVACVLNHHPDLSTAPNREAVWLAFTNRCEKSIDLFIECGFEPNLEDAGRIEALCGAISSNKPEVVVKLLNFGANLKVDLNVAVRHAARYAGNKMIQLLFNSGAEKQVQVLLDLAVSYGNVEAVKYLIAQGVTIKDLSKVLPAAVRGMCNATKLEILRFLLEKGADPNVSDDRGVTPIEQAALIQEGDIMEVLLSHGARLDVDISRCSFSFLQAIQKGSVSAVKCYFKSGIGRVTEGTSTDSLKGVDVNGIKENFNRAISSEEASMVEFFLEFADPDASLFEDISFLEKVILWSQPHQPLTVGKLFLEYGCLSLNAIFCSQILQLIESGDYSHLNGRGGRLFGILSRPSFSDEDNAARLNIVCQHVSAVIAAGLSVNKLKYRLSDKLKEIWTSSSAFQHRDYESEVEAMKNSKIGDTKLSFYDILNASVLEVVSILRDDRVVKVLESKNYGEDFPSYVGMISKQFSRAHFRRTLMEEGIKMLDYLCAGHKLPYEISEMIVDYLSNQDLLIFSNVCKLPSDNDSKPLDT